MSTDILSELVSKNKLLQMLNTKYPGYHPLLSICDIAHHPDTQEDFRLLLDCHKTIVNFVAPSLKSLEVQGEIDHNLSTLKIELSNPADLNIPIHYVEPLAIDYSEYADDNDE